MRTVVRAALSATIALGAIFTPVAAHANPASAPIVVGQLWDGYVDGERNTALPLSVLDQPSGLGASRVNPDVLYVQSEKDRQTMIAVSERDGEVLGKYTVPIPNVYDWEDMAVGPCPTGSCVFAGDIGTNSGYAPKPDNVMSVVRVTEPNLAAGQTTGVLAGDHFPYVYPDGRRPDAEALVVHPVTGEIFVILKTGTGTSPVYRFPTPLPAPGVVSTLVKVADITLPIVDGKRNSAQITAASFHPRKNRLLVRTYTKVYEFRTETWDESPFTGTRVELTDTSEGQGEAIEYEADGSSYFTLSEKVAPPYTLKRVDLTHRGVS